MNTRAWLLFCFIMLFVSVSDFLHSITMDMVNAGWQVIPVLFFGDLAFSTFFKLKSFYVLFALTYCTDTECT